MNHSVQKRKILGYNMDMLVYYEVADDIRSAIQREKRMKKWKREWKIELIEKKNPKWKDLYGEIRQGAW